MAKKKKVKAMTLRQRLRAKAQEKLESLQEDVIDAVGSACDSHNTKINPYDMMRLISGGMTKTLRERLITELANETEAELEALYNKQLGLLEDDTDVSET